MSQEDAAYSRLVARAYARAPSKLRRGRGFAIFRQRSLCQFKFRAARKRNHTQRWHRGKVEALAGTKAGAATANDLCGVNERGRHL